jgi:NAD(P)-dependent dehydrogenase (short-subunit alcohol dehydrogenase family)
MSWSGGAGRAQRAAVKAGLEGTEVPRERRRAGIRSCADGRRRSIGRRPDHEARATARLGEPGEIADAVGFQPAPRATYVNGSVLAVDWGVLAT